MISLGATDVAAAALGDVELVAISLGDVDIWTAAGDVEPPATTNLIGTASATFEGLAHGANATQATDWIRRSIGATTTDPVITTTPAEVIAGAASLKVTKDSNGPVAPWDPIQIDGITTLAVQPSTEYTFRCEMRLPDGAKNCNVFVEWYTAAGASASGTLNGSSVLVGTTGSTVVHATGASPATAAYARPVVRVSSMDPNARVIIDQLSLHQGPDTTFPA